MSNPDDSRFAQAYAQADAGALEEAADAFALGLAEADDTAARTRLGLILRSLGDLDDAIANFAAVHAAAPTDIARLNLALALDEAGQSARALDLLDAAAALLDTSAEARAMAAHVLLRAGRFARGFALYESRWQLGRAQLHMRPYAQPLWRGAARPGARLLVWHEQGLGDSLLAMRFAAVANARGLTVLADVQPTLRALVASMPGVEGVVEPGALPSFDLHIPALSLPHALGLDVAAAGQGLPCITVPDAKARKWAALMPPSTRFRIGLAWRSTIYRDDAGVAQSKHSKSMPLAALAPFGQLRGVELVSLQVAHGSEETAHVPGLDLTDLTAHIDDMADTAALIGRLDLVVCIDTSVAHVAACMGAPLFVLLNSEPDWRWRAGDIDSPWYPAARVFRQSVRNDWRGPVAAACGAARALAAAQKSPSLLARWFGRR